MLVAALVAEPAVEALDVAVPHGETWLDKDVADVVLLCPGDAGAAGEFWTVVGSDSDRIAPESRRVIISRRACGAIFYPEHALERMQVQVRLG